MAHAAVNRRAGSARPAAGPRLPSLHGEVWRALDALNSLDDIGSGLGRFEEGELLREVIYLVEEHIGPDLDDAASDKHRVSS